MTRCLALFGKPRYLGILVLPEDRKPERGEILLGPVPPGRRVGRPGGGRDPGEGKIPPGHAGPSRPFGGRQRVGTGGVRPSVPFGGFGGGSAAHGGAPGGGGCDPRPRPGDPQGTPAPHEAHRRGVPGGSEEAVLLLHLGAAGGFSGLREGSGEGAPHPHRTEAGGGPGRGQDHPRPLSLRSSLLLQLLAPAVRPHLHPHGEGAEPGAESHQDLRDLRSPHVLHGLRAPGVPGAVVRASQPGLQDQGPPGNLHPPGGGPPVSLRALQRPHGGRPDRSGGPLRGVPGGGSGGEGLGGGAPGSRGLPRGRGAPARPAGGAPPRPG